MIVLVTLSYFLSSLFTAAWFPVNVTQACLKVIYQNSVHSKVNISESVEGNNEISGKSAKRN